MYIYLVLHWAVDDQTFSVRIESFQYDLSDKMILKNPNNTLCVLNFLQESLMCALHGGVLQAGFLLSTLFYNYFVFSLLFNSRIIALEAPDRVNLLHCRSPHSRIKNVKLQINISKVVFLWEYGKYSFTGFFFFNKTIY